MSTILKCKICGGTLAFNHNSKIVICEYCGTKQVLPLFSDDSAQILYERGTNYLRHNEYDKAETIFNQLVALAPTDPEIYWDLVLCKYGVTFMKDSDSGKYIPTCNRTHFQSVLQDDNYKKALEYSDDEKTVFYSESAETIDQIQRGILAVSRKEKPYDIFISYKETDSAGNRTPDSVKAQNLYEKLTQLGYKVFLARITLEDKIGTEYEPYIYAALYSARIMLTVSSSKENIEAPWVKNEWSRYLSLRQNNPNKTLIPLYYDMQRSELPDEFAILAAQDMKKSDFEQELLRGIKKMIPLPVMIAERRRKIKKRVGIVSACVIPIFLIVGIIAYPNLTKNIENRRKYEEAMTLYNEENYTEAAELFSQISGYKDAETMTIDAEQMVKYTNAMQLYYESDYCGAAWAFAEISDYKDAYEMQKQAELNWRMQLATVAVNNDRFDSGGEYYISSNGSVKSFSENPGSASDNLEVDSHGKIISITSNEYLYALYEDGYVKNSKDNNGLAEEWSNIIQITSRFNSTSVALTNKGTVVYGDVSGKNPYNSAENDAWLCEVDDWHDIVSLSYDHKEYEYAGVTSSALLGIKRDGTIYSVFYTSYSDEHNQNLLQEAKKFTDGLTNIKYINVSVSIDGIAIAAIDNTNHLFTFMNGEIQTFDNIESRAVQTFEPRKIDGIDNFYLLDNKYKCKELGTNNVLMSDVVYMDQYYLITKMGNVYSDYCENSPRTRNAQTCVYDVWLERN